MTWLLVRLHVLMHLDNTDRDIRSQMGNTTAQKTHKPLFILCDAIADSINFENSSFKSPRKIGAGMESIAMIVDQGMVHPQIAANLDHMVFNTKRCLFKGTIRVMNMYNIQREHRSWTHRT